VEFTKMIIYQNANVQVLNCECT